MQLQSAVRIANIARFQKMLIELADGNGAIHGWRVWELAALFNKRYAGEIKPIACGAIRGYIVAGRTAGWLSTSERIRGKSLIFTIIFKADELGGTG